MQDATRTERVVRRTVPLPGEHCWATGRPPCIDSQGPTNVRG